MVEILGAAYNHHPAIVYALATYVCGYGVGSGRWIKTHKGTASPGVAICTVLGTRPNLGFVAAVSQMADQ